jgi:hypothetical protein
MRPNKHINTNKAHYRITTLFTTTPSHTKPPTNRAILSELAMKYYSPIN